MHTIKWILNEAHSILYIINIIVILGGIQVNKQVKGMIRMDIENYIVIGKIIQTVDVCRFEKKCSEGKTLAIKLFDYVSKHSDINLDDLNEYIENMNETTDNDLEHITYTIETRVLNEE